MVESGITSSFIPRDAKVVDAATSAPIRHSNRGLAELLTFVSIIFVVASFALAAAVFLYQQFLIQQSASKLDSLKRAEGAFDPALIQQITRLDDRMHIAAAILSTHIAPSVLLRALDSLTLTTVSYASLDAQTGNNGIISLKMSGVGQSINSIALQADVFGKSGIFLNPIFSNIDRQVDGVHFSVESTVNPSSVTYDKVGSVGTPTTVPVDTSTPPTQSSATSSSPAGSPPNSSKAQAPAQKSVFTPQQQSQ